MNHDIDKYIFLYINGILNIGRSDLLNPARYGHHFYNGAVQNLRRIIDCTGAAVWRQSPLPYISTPQYNKAKRMYADYLSSVSVLSNDTVNQINNAFKQEFKEDYGKLLADLKEKSPDAKTYICKIPPIFGKENAPFTKAAPEIDKLIEEVPSSSYSSLIDLNTPFASSEGLFSDGLHPNEEGARLIAESVINALKEDLF